MELLGAEAADKFFLPDILHANGQWSIAASGLPIERAQVVIRELAEVGASSVDAEPVTTYAFRRFFPTVSESLQLSETERSSLGNWVDRLTQTQGGRRGPEPMHAKYSDSRLEESANVKRLILSVLHASLLAGQAEAHQELAAFVPHIADYKAQVRSTAWGTFSTQASMATSSTTSAIAPCQASAPSPRPTRSSTSPSPSRAASSPSSSSTPDPSPRPPDRPTHASHQADAQRWITPRWRKGAIHIAIGEEGGGRLCSTAELDWGWEEGKGPFSAAAASRPLCQGCLQKTPRTIAEAFRAARAD